MSTRERYIKVIESLVNGEEAKAADQLHEAFVEKAREIWNDLVEQDEIIEDEVAEEESVDETVGGDKADDFIYDTSKKTMKKLKQKKCMAKTTKATKPRYTNQKLKWNYR